MAAVRPLEGAAAVALLSAAAQRSAAEAVRVAAVLRSQEAGHAAAVRCSEGEVSVAVIWPDARSPAVPLSVRGSVVATGKVAAGIGTVVADTGTAVAGMAGPGGAADTGPASESA
uniref:Putative exported peptidase n=1 Tax=Rhodopseudomonas palustris (strain DX-1) TaxID=652103 RepID=E6VMR6_RHOPX